MKIEVVGFYPQEVNPKNKTFFGTLHVYVVDLKMDIRGISVKGTKSNVFIRLPQKTAFDTDEKKEVKFPVINFTEEAFQEDFKKSLFSVGQKYIKENFINSGLNLVEVKKKQNNVQNPKKKSFNNIQDKRPKSTFNKFTTYKNVKY